VSIRLKGVTVWIWILGFFAFLAGANVINATIMWFEIGPTGTFTPFLGDFIGAIPVYVYMLISVLATLVFLGAASQKVLSELSVVDQMTAIDEKTNRLQASQESHRLALQDVQNRMSMVNETIERNGNKLSWELSKQGDSIKHSVTTGDQTQQKLLDGIQGRLFLVDENLNDYKKRLDEQTELIKAVDGKLDEKINSALSKFESRDDKTVAAIQKQRREIEKIRLKIEKLESSLVMPKSLLTSQNNVEDVKGIGPNKATELKEIGITTAGDLIMADPKVVAAKMSSSDETVEKLQGRAQLAMIPGLKEKDLFLLEELDITNRKSLALQDPIELAKRINAIFKVNLAKGRVSENDRPTIEEVDSWVKFTRA
jgi:predicted flap endonuclease-1-like 5' DNA nuclease